MDKLTPYSSDRESSRLFEAWDIETYEGKNGKNILRGIGSYNPFDGIYRYFDEFSEFYEYFKTKEDHIFYSHYGGRFDMLFLLDFFSKLSKKKSIRLIFQGARIVIMKVEIRPRKYVTFWDSFSIYPMGLEKLLKLYGLAGEKGKVDYNRFSDDEYWNIVGKPYLEQDCKGLAKLILVFHKMVEDLGGRIRPTLASTSMSIFLGGFLKEEIYRNSEFNNYFRHGYVGGRCEVFKKNASKIYGYDLNSLYPYVMSKYIYPVGKCRIRSKFREIDSKKETSFVEAKIIVKRNTFIPVLPYRDHKKKKVIFPTGKFHGLFSYRELMFALKNNQFEHYEIYKQFIFPSKNIFGSFVDKLYKLRLESSNELESKMFKLFLNSSYGKFCERIEKQEICLFPSASEIRDKNLEAYIASLGIWKLDKSNDKSTIIVSIGAMITANARLELTKTLLRLHEAGYVIYYCDTDSVYTNAPPEVFNISENLGDWKLTDRVDKAEFLYPKTYWLYNSDGREKFKTKGIHVETYVDFNLFATGKYIKQKDVVKVSPFKKAVRETGKILGYVPVKKRNKFPSPKRLEDGPLMIWEDNKPEWMD